MSSDATLSQQILTLHELTRHSPSIYLRAWASIHLQAIIDERQWLRHVIVEYMESKFEFAGQAEPDDKLSEVWRVRQGNLFPGVCNLTDLPDIAPDS